MKYNDFCFGTHNHIPACFLFTILLTEGWFYDKIVRAVMVAKVNPCIFSEGCPGRSFGGCGIPVPVLYITGNQSERLPVNRRRRVPGQNRL